MQGASVKQTRSVCSERARTPAGGRSRCGFAKQIRGFFAQTSDSKRMRCYRISACHAPHQRNPKPAENRTLCRARALSKRYGNAGWDALSQWRPRRKVRPGVRTQTGTWFPDGTSSGNRIPESSFGMGCIFRMGCWRKAHPGIRAQNGTRFPNDSPSGKRVPESRLKLGRAIRSIFSTPKPMRPPFQNWVEESQNAIAGGQYDCRR